MRECFLRKFGLIGGMSWVSTRSYYEDINRMIQKRVGPESSAPLLIESLDFSKVYRISDRDEWETAARVLSESAVRLEQAGAGAIAITANSMHAVYDRVADAVSVPVIHIADCVAARMKEKGIDRAALLGTRNVMMDDFYRRRLIDQDIELLPPAVEIVDQLDKIIYEELMVGRVRRGSQRIMKTMLTNFEKDGADAVVLACTELELIVDVDANVLTVFDGAHIHAESIVDWILGGDEGATVPG